MDFTIEINLGFGDTVKYNTCDFWKVVALASFVENMEEIDDDVDFIDDEEEDEEYEYDEEGTAYWYDEENEVYYWYDEASDDWYECSDEEEVEDEGDEIAE
jgi:hypothetical protein